jgi:hypothetical protein
MQIIDHLFHNVQAKFNWSNNQFKHFANMRVDGLDGHPPSENNEQKLINYL